MTSCGLERLDLAANGLRSRIPAEWGNLDALWELHLYELRLFGAIPPSLGDLGSLRFLYLPERGLTGCIPAGLRFVEYHNLDRLRMRFCADSE